MTNTTALLANVLEIVAIIAFILWRQLATRRARETARTPLILGAAGLLMVGQYLQTRPLLPGLFASLTVGLLVSAALAYPRAASLRIWRDASGRLMRSGTWVTLVWWLAVIAVRFGIAAIVPRALGVPAADASAFSAVSALLSLSVTLGLQQWLVLRRAARLVPPAPQDVLPGGVARAQLV